MGNHVPEILYLQNLLIFWTSDFKSYVLCLTVLSLISPKEEMVRDTGLEPVTPTVSRWCSTTELTALAVACGREDIRN